MQWPWAADRGLWSGGTVLSEAPKQTSRRVSVTMGEQYLDHRCDGHEGRAAENPERIARHISAPRKQGSPSRSSCS